MGDDAAAVPKNSSSGQPGIILALILSLLGNAATVVANIDKILGGFESVTHRILGEPVGQVRFTTDHAALRKEGVVQVTDIDGKYDYQSPFGEDLSIRLYKPHKAVARLRTLTLPDPRQFKLDTNDGRYEIKIADTFAVQGHVTLGDPAKPLRGVKVLIETKKAVSDPQGVFYLEGLPPKTQYSVVAHHKGRTWRSTLVAQGGTAMQTINLIPPRQAGAGL